jgi:hypothetical protein
VKLTLTKGGFLCNKRRDIGNNVGSTVVGKDGGGDIGNEDESTIGRLVYNAEEFDGVEGATRMEFATIQSGAAVDKDGGGDIGNEVGSTVVGKDGGGDIGTEVESTVGRNSPLIGMGISLVPDVAQISQTGFLHR